MKNPIQPTTSLTILDPTKGGEVTFELLFDFQAIARAEDISGRSLLIGIAHRDIAHPPLSFVCAMLFAALLHNEPKITFAEASAFVTWETADLIWGKVLEAWVAAMPKPKASPKLDEEAPADPPTSQS